MVDLGFPAGQQCSTGSRPSAAGSMLFSATPRSKAAPVNRWCSSFLPVALHEPDRAVRLVVSPPDHAGHQIWPS